MLPCSMWLLQDRLSPMTCCYEESVFFQIKVDFLLIAAGDQKVSVI